MSEITRLTLPAALRSGDGISIVAPASPPKRAAFEAAMSGLQAAGYRPKTYRDFCAGDPAISDGYLAGADDARIAELEAAFADPDTTMVLAARGGYGCGRLLDRIDFGRLHERPKIVAGYSDLTALHAAIGHRAGLVGFHGPNLLYGLGDTRDKTRAERAAAWALFRGEVGVGDTLVTRVDDRRPIRGGVAEGRLVGGNLAVLVSILGTPDQPDFDDAILLLEDTGEVPYRIDRLLTQLRQAGLLRRLAGVALGFFTKTGDRSGNAAEAVLHRELQALGVPVLDGLPVGHEHPNHPVPLGACVHLDADQGVLTLGEPVVTT